MCRIVGCFIWIADMFMRDGLHVSGNCAVVLAEEPSAAIDSVMGKHKQCNSIVNKKNILNIMVE